MHPSFVRHHVQIRFLISGQVYLESIRDFEIAVNERLIWQPTCSDARWRPQIHQRILKFNAKVLGGEDVLTSIIYPLEFLKEREFRQNTIVFRHDLATTESFKAYQVLLSDIPLESHEVLWRLQIEWLDQVLYVLAHQLNFDSEGWYLQRSRDEWASI